MTKPPTRLHRIASWLLVLFSITTILTGYSLARGWFPDQYLLSFIHRLSEIGFLGFLILHFDITFRFYKFNWSKTLGMIRAQRGTSIHLLRLIQRVTSVLIVVFVIAVVITGLSGYDFIAQAIEDVIPFAPHRVLDIFLVSAIIIHVGVGIRFILMRRGQKHPLSRVFVIGLVLSVLFVTASLNLDLPFGGPGDGNIGNEIVWIDKTPFNFSSDEVNTVRPDLFKSGSFSMFDVLANVAEKGLIELEYHFDESMNTHVIDLLEGESSWWYEVIYSGGWSELSTFRMDHYPWKEGTHLMFYQESSDFIEKIHKEFREEVERFSENAGQVIIPQVFISGPDVAIYAKNVLVTPHNLRNDTLQDGVITAIDVIMTLADQGILEYELQWYDSIGDADVVRSYWVEAINGRKSYGFCGWVYESGSWEFSGFFGNHIHLPSDVRVINSPDYVEWFWICV